MGRRILNDALRTIVNAERRGKASVELKPSSTVMSSFLRIMKEKKFYNTISNVPVVLLALIGLLNALRQRFEKRFSILHISNMILIIGSMLYHATLQRLQQQSDETPMVWEILLYMYILYSPDWRAEEAKKALPGSSFTSEGFRIIQLRDMLEHSKSQ